MANISTEEEKELLSLLKIGDKSAFEVLYRGFYGVLYLHAYRKIKHREIAKDIVQDLFTVLWQIREQLDIKVRLSSYLYGAIRNRIIDLYAKEQSQTKYLDSLQRVINDNYVPADAVVREKMLAEQIEKALQQMPPRMYQVFDLSRKQYLTHKEIARELKISEHTVRSYIKDALRILRYKLGSYLWLLVMLFAKYF
jgi:RNA polymerase sigma-70 factor (ECF subfamily)